MGEHCCYCLRKLPFVFIQCIQCQEVLLCPNCFRLGAESSKHKRCHKYALGKSASHWAEFMRAVEKELAFLEYVESCGLGNWLDVSTKLGNMSPLECRRHYESTYVSGVIGSGHKSPRYIMDLNTKDQSTNDLFAICKAHSPAALNFCRRLGLMPKRGDYECVSSLLRTAAKFQDYDNNAEVSIARIRSDFLDDELYRDLTLARIDMFIEILRQRQIRHMVAAKLNLLAHALPELFPRRVTSGSHKDSGGSGKPSRSHLNSQQRLRRRMLRATRCNHISEGSGYADDFPTEEAVKQPSSSMESPQGSGIAFSEISIHSLPSADTPATASVLSLAKDVVASGGNNRGASPSTAPTTHWSCILPIVGSIPLGAASLVDSSSVHPSSSAPSYWTNAKTNGTSHHPSNAKGKSLNNFDQDILSPELNCCIPPHFSEPLKPLLRFLSRSEANILLHQLHREHVLRQEIEQLQQLKQSRGVFLSGAHLAGEVMSAVGGDSDESSPEDSRKELALRTGGAAMPSRRRRGVGFGTSRRSNRRANRLSNLVRVRRQCGNRSSGANESPAGSVVVPRRRGRPSLHNQGNRQQSQHQLIHM